MSIYDFNVLDANKQVIPLKNYEGKVMLIVNTATGCRYTPQYKGLQDLYRKYQEQGLEILDFPCNQFAFQAPESDEDIVAFCKLKYAITFKIFAKVKVNGVGASPLFRYLKKQQDDMLGRKIKWNFTKFLVDRNGNVIGRFAPGVEPTQLEDDIVAALAH